MSPRKRGERPPYLRVVPDWVREERDRGEPSHRKPAARGKGARRGFGTTWWGAAWVEALEGRAQLDPNRLPRGRSYARSGAVGELELSVGLVRAKVQGSRPDPYDVTVRVRVFDDKEWDRVLDVVAARVGRAAALLDGEVPPSVADDVTAAGSSLLPGPGELQPRCSCPDWADPCKHAAAVCYLVADELDADPFALLRLRGRDRDAVLAALRRRRRGELSVDEPDEGLGASDDGVPARTAFDPGRARPALPSPPLPPAQPGQPAALASDPPARSGVSTQSLALLAADAAMRAQLLLVGDDDATDATALQLSVEHDAIRRVAVGTADPLSVALSSAVGLRGTDLARRTEAWRVGGAAGVSALVGSWDAPAALLAPGVEALGPGARRRANRVTNGDVQLRLDDDGRWHPFQRVGSEWQLAGPSSDDAATAAGAATAAAAATARREL